MSKQSQNDLPSAVELQKRMSLQQRVQNCGRFRHALLRFEGRFLESKQEELLAVSCKFAMRHIDAANGHLKQADGNYGYQASYSAIIHITKNGFYPHVLDAASSLKKAMKCYERCSSKDKETLLPQLSCAIRELIPLLSFADKALGEYSRDSENKPVYALRDPGSYFKSAIWFAGKLGQLFPDKANDAHYRVYVHFMENNPHLSEECRCNLHLAAYAAAPDEDTKKRELKILNEKYGLSSRGAY